MKDIKKFGKYAQTFNINEHMIELKLAHSVKVALNCEKIAKDVFPDNNELSNLAYTIGLLHDISRFEQWSTYKTFIDRESFDHGDYSVDLLFNKNKILEYDIDPKWYPYIYIAIKNHNKLKISETELKEYCNAQNIDYDLAKTYCFMIRDADKLDIARVFIKNPNDMDLSKTAEKFGYSPEMMRDFKSHRLCDYRFRKTILDFALGYLAFPFDFNFEKSNQIFAESAENYANSIKARYYRKLENVADKATLVSSCNHLSEYFEKYKTKGE